VAIRILVSPDPDASFDESWEIVGTLDPSDGHQNREAAKKLTKHPGGGQRGITFYLAGDPAARWVKASEEHTSFAIAFDLFGDGAQVLISSGPARVRPLAERVPEPHPGMKIVPVYLGIRVDHELRPAD
jgi:hypothetical protein